MVFHIQENRHTFALVEMLVQNTHATLRKKYIHKLNLKNIEYHERKEIAL